MIYAEFFGVVLLYTLTRDVHLYKYTKIDGEKKVLWKIIMSKSTIPVAPFVCKWRDAHNRPQRFDTQEKLEHHVYNDHKDLANLKWVFLTITWEESFGF